jgi:tetratricopeptide (TPR) repeat protein
MMVATLAIMVGAAILLAGRKSGGAGIPYVPAVDSEVLERVPAGRSDPAAREIQELRRALATDPKNVRIATAFARRNIEEARATSDPRYLGHAQAALAPWWGDSLPPADVLLLRATIRQSLHEFDSALVDLDLLLRDAPDDAQVWLTRSVVLTVRGEYGEAKRSCEPLLRLAGDLVSSQCIATIDSLTGNAHQAYDRLRGAYARNAAPTANEAGWILSSLGEVSIRAGDDAGGEANYRAALQANPLDAYTLAAYSDLLLDLGRPMDVLPLLHGHENDDGLLLRLAIAEKMVRAREADRHVEMLRSRHASSVARGDLVHRREQSRSALALEGDPVRALDLAVGNWAVQKEPWDARIVLESALAEKKPDAARSVVEFLASNRAEEPRLLALVARVRETRR